MRLAPTPLPGWGPRGPTGQRAAPEDRGRASVGGRAEVERPQVPAGRRLPPPCVGPPRLPSPGSAARAPSRQPPGPPRPTRRPALLLPSLRGAQGRRRRDGPRPLGVVTPRRERREREKESERLEVGEWASGHYSRSPLPNRNWGRTGATRGRPRASLGLACAEGLASSPPSARARRPRPSPGSEPSMGSRRKVDPSADLAPDGRRRRLFPSVTGDRRPPRLRAAHPHLNPGPAPAATSSPALPLRADRRTLDRPEDVRETRVGPG